MLRLSITTVVLAAWCATAAPARACNVPVFRYALERWEPEAYEVTIFHRGPLSSDDRRLANEFADLGDGPQATANFTTSLVDVTTAPAGPLAELWKKHASAPLPLVVVRAPESGPSAPDLWSGPLDAETVATIVQSPARTKLVQRLLAGESAVWLLLESGDQAADDAAQETLNTGLSALEQTLKLPPPQAGEDASSGPQLRADFPLCVKFSVLRVSRTDPAEALLLQTLLTSEPDLAAATKPIAFPVFGRGRALWAMIGGGINAQVMQQSAEYIVGACSCEAKRQNPGTDLLLAADWAALVEDRPLKALQSPSLAALVSARGETQLTRDRVSPADEPLCDGSCCDTTGSAKDCPFDLSNPMTRNLLIGVAATAAALVGGTLLVVVRSQRRAA